MLWQIPDAALIGGAFVLDSRAKGITTVIPDTINVVVTGGYYEPGDGGGAVFKKVAGPLTDSASFQSDDGAWWQIVDSNINPRQFGAKCDSVFDDTSAAQECFDFGLPVILNGDLYTSEDVTGNHNDIDFAGYKIVALNDFVMSQAVFFVNSKNGFNYKSVNVDCGNNVDLVAFKTFNCTNYVIDSVVTDKGPYLIEGDNSVNSNAEIGNINLNVESTLYAGCYFSAVNGINVKNIICVSAKEGVSFYNEAHNINISNIISHDHSGDGVAFIGAYNININNIVAFDCGQSGIVTQRQTAGDNVHSINIANYICYGNAFDGVDCRGSNPENPPWEVNTDFNFGNGLCYDNRGTGVYIVKAEGSKFEVIVTRLNDLQGVLIDESDRVQIGTVSASSNCLEMDSGIDKAGVYANNSLDLTIGNINSGNWNGPASQEYGFSSAGSTGSINGGSLNNNTVLAYNGTGFSVDGVNIALSGSLFVSSIDPDGVYHLYGFGPPTGLSYPKNSTYNRRDGGVPEDYITNGSAVWYFYNLTLIP